MHSVGMQRRAQRTEATAAAPAWGGHNATTDTYKAASQWGREHPDAVKGTGIVAGAMREAEHRARFFWHRLQSGKLTGAAAEQVRHRYRQWFERFALE